MRVIGYARVSSEEQARDGVSLDAQVEKIRLYGQLHGLQVLDIIVDGGFSAKSLDRPGLQRALALLDHGVAAGVVVGKLDRLTRSLADWSSLIERYFARPGGPSLFSVSDSIDTRTAAGRMVLNMLMSVAQWERETIVERTQSAMNFKRSRGERISGRIPYGSDLGGDGRTLVDNPAEQRVLETIRCLVAEGIGPRGVAARLNDSAIPAKGGGRWSHSSIQSLMSRLAPAGA